MQTSSAFGVDNGHPRHSGSLRQLGLFQAGQDAKCSNSAALILIRAGIVAHEEPN
jgi:hypothetical protein